VVLQAAAIQAIDEHLVVKGRVPYTETSAVWGEGNILSILCRKSQVLLRVPISSHKEAQVVLAIIPLQ
jgi:hypothetical protein